MSERYLPIPCDPPERIDLNCVGALESLEAEVSHEHARLTISSFSLARIGAEEARRLAHWLSAFADSRIQTAADPGAGEGPGSAAPTTYLDEDD